MQRLSPSPSPQQMSNTMIRSPGIYNHSLPSPTVTMYQQGGPGSNNPNIHSPHSNYHQGPPSVGSTSITGPPSVDNKFSNAPSPGNPMSTPRQPMPPSPAQSDADQRYQQKLQELAS